MLGYAEHLYIAINKLKLYLICVKIAISFYGEWQIMNVIVVGAGAAGLVATWAAKGRGNHVTVIEKNHRPARKVMITGKGRCNLTNNCSISEFIENIPRNNRFLYSSVNLFTPQDTMDMITAMGVELKTERGNRVFPVSDKAVDIVDALYGNCRGCKFLFDTEVASLSINNGVCNGVILDNGARIDADAVIVCTGGISYPTTGSTGDGYIFAESAGHSIVEPRPSLVPIEIAEDCCSQMSGLSLKNIAVRFVRDGKTVYDDFGEMIFTHFGVSGPVILSASAKLDSPENTVMYIDFKPALTDLKLEERLKRDISEDINKSVSNMMCGLLPRAAVPHLLQSVGINPDLKCNQITAKMRADLCKAMKAFKLHPTGFRPISEAIITRGGIAVNEVNPKTMQSKKCDGLYFAGEVLDVDGYTGGFNLQIAFSTGYCAGISI